MPTPDFVPPILLIRQDGEVFEYSSLEELDAACRAAHIYLAAKHVDWITRFGMPDRVVHEWIGRDSTGRPVTHDDLKAIRRPYRHSFLRRYDLQEMAVQRGLPIPYVGRRWARGRGMFRRPRHHGVHREMEVCRVVEREERWQVKGRKARPPTAWDDIVASDCGHRTWKRSRRTRWRKPSVSYKLMTPDD